MRLFPLCGAMYIKSVVQSLLREPDSAVEEAGRAGAEGLRLHGKASRPRLPAFPRGTARGL
jgi:hypothetical protein